MARPNVGSVADNFNRADGAIGSNWSNDPFRVTSSAAVISSNTAKCTGSYSEMWYNVASYANTSGIAAGLTLAGTLPTQVGSGGFNGWYIGLIQQPSASLATADGYQLALWRRTGGDTYAVYKYTNSTASLILTETALASNLALTDTFDLEVTLSGVINVYRNGTNINNVTDTTFFHAGESAFGEFALSDSNNLAAIDDFYVGQVIAGQKARPSSMITRGSWTDNTSSTTGANLVAAINETTANDSTYIQSSSSPGSTADISEFKFSAVGDPLSSTGHIVRYRYQKDTTGGDTINLTVRLIQGTSEITNWTHSNIDAITTAAQTLTGPQADAITDYSDLRLRFEATSA